MFKRKFLHTISLGCLSFLLIAFSACEKFEGDQTIPAYLKIDSIALTTDYTHEGTESHNFTDAWVYVDDNMIGAFQLPAEFPVLAKGTHKITIMPGIKNNGIAATRTNYPFCEPIIMNVDLYQDSTVSLGTLETSYYASTEFLLLEDFDGVACDIDTNARSQVPIQRTPVGYPATFEGNHSALIEMDSVGTLFECVNNADFEIPSAAVYMEMNFNTNNPVAVGVYLYGYSMITQVPVIYLNPTNGAWKKIYINLTNVLNSQTGAENFRIFISATHTEGVEHAEIRLDNIKVISRVISK